MDLKLRRGSTSAAALGSFFTFIGINADAVLLKEAYPVPAKRKRVLSALKRTSPITDLKIMADAEREALESHLNRCAHCRARYEEDKELVALVRSHWAAGSEGGVTPFQADRSQASRPKAAARRRLRPMTAREGWEDLKRRCPDLAEACRRREPKDGRRRLFWRIGASAAAACVIAAGISWLAAQGGDTVRPSGRDAAATRIQDRTPKNALVELITPSGRQRVPLGNAVRSLARPQELLLGGIHRVVMNADATASFEAACAGPPAQSGADEGQVAYEVRLTKGEVYVEIVPGHSFTVRTPNALMTVAGTKFDVLASPGRTELTVVEGSVRFNHVRVCDQEVTVTAGFASRVAGRSVPSVPRKVDAQAAAAWARRLMLTNRASYFALETDLLESIESGLLQPSPPDLDSVDYRAWLKSHRGWFAKEFPWIFRMQAALKGHDDVEADYLDLLMISGDIWQFHYPRPVNQRIALFDASAVSRVAQHYRADGTVLLRAACADRADSQQLASDAASSAKKHAGQPGAGYEAAMRNWGEALQAAADTGHVQNDLLLFALRASSYLANTRAAAYLWVKAHPQKAQALLKDKDYASRYLAPVGFRGPMGPAAWTDSLGGQVAGTGKAARAAQQLLMAARPGDSSSGEGEATPALTELSRWVSALVSDRRGDER